MRTRRAKSPKWVNVGGQRPERLTSPAADRAAALDRKWFKEHPGATSRVRPYVAGEFGALMVDCALVWVRQIRDGIRLRQPIAANQISPNGHRDTYLRIDPATGSVLGRYSEYDDAWTERLYRQLRAAAYGGYHTSHNR
jgi:hypothetical protein